MKANQFSSHKNVTEMFSHERNSFNDGLGTYGGEKEATSHAVTTTTPAGPASTEYLAVQNAPACTAWTSMYANYNAQCTGGIQINVFPALSGTDSG